MNIKDKIYEVHGSKIILDRDLAGLIGYNTKVLNQLVKRNINKFENNDYYQVNQEEFSILKSQSVTSNVINHGGVRYLPYAFSRNGIRILSTILRKEQSKETIDEILNIFEEKNEITMPNKNTLIQVNTGNSYQNMIYEIRGQLVMLDSDLAKLYGCANGTKTINQAVSRNRDLFPDDFYFKLTTEEYLKILRSQSGTLKTKRDHFQNIK